MNINIQPIQDSDFSELYPIETAAHTVPWSLGTLKNNQGDNYLNLKILQQQQIVGFCICQVVLDEATLFNIAIDPTFQGNGLGKQLLQELMNQLINKGVNTLWLEVRESNKKAQSLYQALGFNEVTLRKNYYPLADGGREHAVIMACYL
ncbi:ribosomal protein S18-alanine N-acetyltransferase [Gallibacterium salpingitidis]|uniref:[Ribosomal protein bS18]-alanine N-acetyltransferase n=1 Tax=Gallibacterium salpingitidis TaxID=505341 RepID=A0A1A7NYT1_9PAST|nr:ribosomal protein S18-alanine N-acetyltransferase [Gallibacterium salpingitidis]OBW94858.1 alanine acetyltransferase [Gallibacterium salpingitidis]